MGHSAHSYYTYYRTYNRNKSSLLHKQTVSLVDIIQTYIACIEKNILLMFTLCIHHRLRVYTTSTVAAVLHRNTQTHGLHNYGGKQNS